jgi:DNA mismatch repair protein MutL
MYLMDQHAAAERVNYEKCFDKVLSNNVEPITLLVPISVEVTKNEFLVIREHLDLLKEIGFDTEEFSDNSFIVRTHPSWLHDGIEKSDIEKIFEIIAHNESFSKEKFLDHMVATMACRMSIKANDYIMGT